MATATNSTILLLVLSISCLCSTRDVYIQPSEGEHCPGTCYNITTFGKMADSFSNSFHLVVHFLEGTHFLDLQELVVFTNLTNAVFEGDGRMEQGFHETVWQSTVVIKCTEHSSTGITFANSSNITFRYITITNCGAYVMKNYFKQLIPSMNASLVYHGVSNSIVIDCVSVQNGTGSGLLVITEGVDLTITNSSFAQNVFSGSYIVGSNVYIRYTDPLNCSAPQSNVYKANIISTHLSFGDYKPPFGNASYFTGGGLCINLYHGSYGVAIVLDSVIAYGNRGCLGNVCINGKETKFPTYNVTINNFLSTNAQGPALLITNAADAGHHIQCNVNLRVNMTVLITNSKFIDNNNDYNIYKSNMSTISFDFAGLKFTSTIMIESTEVCNNIGAGIQFRLTVSNEQQSQMLVTLSNFIANNNSLPDFLNNGDTISYEASIVAAIFVTTLVLNNVSITSNNMTGIFVYRTAIVVNGTSVFYNNTGIDGGGLAMYGTSYLVLKENSFLNFTNNKAKNRGGAIFVERVLERFPCFFQNTFTSFPKSAKVALIGNKADTAGSVLFGGDIMYCDLFNVIYFYKNDRLFKQIFNYSAQAGSSVISSEPTDVCFCDNNNTINCPQTDLTMTAYPGEKINISIVTVGQLNGTAPGILQIQPHDNVLYTTSAKECKTIEFTPAETTYSLRVRNEPHRKYLHIMFNQCPLGFEISNKTRGCDCEELKKTVAAITCVVATNTIIHPGNIWIGNISDCIVVHTPCPLDYCNTAHVNFSLTDPDPQCALNRTGILCGRCRDRFSLALGSNNCIQCPEFSYLALIIPFAAAGFGLVALLMVLNLTVSIGTINGLIFYASIVKISENTGIFFPNGSIPVLSQFIAWLNLDLGIETCFYRGMTAYEKVWLQFAFPLYIWFIIVTIIVLCHYSTWLSNKIGGNVVQVLATLILLSFTKIFRTAILAIKFQTLGCVNSNTSASVVVWYMDGNVQYLSIRHALLMAAAVLFLLLAVPYTLALLFDAVIKKYLTRIKFFRKQWIKFKPFVDAYYGPYKDNCRFWTGLLLLVRMSFTLVSLELDTYASLIFITTSTSVLLSLMVYFGGVYQKSYLNILEWSSLINLILFSAIYSSLHDKSGAQQLVTVVSVSVALVMFLGVIIREHGSVSLCRDGQKTKWRLQCKY